MDHYDSHANASQIDNLVCIGNNIFRSQSKDIILGYMFRIEISYFLTQVTKQAGQTRMDNIIFFDTRDEPLSLFDPLRAFVVTLRSVLWVRGLHNVVWYSYGRSPGRKLMKCRRKVDKRVHVLFFLVFPFFSS